MDGTTRYCGSLGRCRLSKRRFVAMRAKVLAVLTLAYSTASAFDPGRASFAVRINDEVVPYEVFATYSLPGEVLDLEVIGAGGRTYQISPDTGVRPLGPRNWSFSSPSEPGLYRVAIVSPTDRIQLNLFVMHPSTSLDNGHLNGYRVGAYPATPLRGDAVYLPPDGFIEVNEQTAAVRVSPHFRLSQFPSKQAGGNPKYLVLRERLLLKLELLLEHVNENGVATDDFTIMSGYRTPFYNAAIGNGRYSRHVYGGAADVFIDANPRDNQMDDINGDGKSDYRDAQWLYQLANRFFARDEHRRLIGGLGVYRRTSAHGPFLHIDARGSRARWGLLP